MNTRGAVAVAVICALSLPIRAIGEELTPSAVPGYVSSKDIGGALIITIRQDRDTPDRRNAGAAPVRDRAEIALAYLDTPEVRAALGIHAMEELVPVPPRFVLPEFVQPDHDAWVSASFERRIRAVKVDVGGVVVYLRHGEIAELIAPKQPCTDAMVAALDAMEQDPGRYVSRERALEIAREDNRPAVEKDPYAHIRGNPPPVIELFLVNDPDPLQWDVQIPSVRYRISAHSGAILRKHSLVIRN